MIDRIVLIVLIALLTHGCIETQSSQGSQPEEEVSIGSATETLEVSNPDAVYSLLGTELDAKKLNTRELRKREAELEKARQKYETDPTNEEAIIWYGRRLGYLGRYQEAIRVFSIGLDKNEGSFRLLRHRGHRYITTRQFDKAIDDLQKAAFYSRPAKNETEPDGLPNKLNVPLGNDKYNIFYHLGIAYYLRGNYDKAISAFKKCLTFADNDDLKVACTDWFYMTYRKIGNPKAADELLTTISRKTEVIENKDYLNRILMYKNIYQADVLLEYAEREADSLEPTLGYGIGNWYLYNGEVEKARDIFERIILNSGWDAFGYIAAEAELATMRRAL